MMTNPSLRSQFTSATRNAPLESRDGIPINNPYRTIFSHLIDAARRWTPEEFPRIEMLVFNDTSHRIETVHDPKADVYSILYSRQLSVVTNNLTSYAYIEEELSLDGQRFAAHALFFDLFMRATLQKGRPQLAYDSAILFSLHNDSLSELSTKRNGFLGNKLALGTLGLTKPVTHRRQPRRILSNFVATATLIQETFFIAHEIAHIIYASSEKVRALLDSYFMKSWQSGYDYMESARENPAMGRRPANSFAKLHEADWVAAFKTARGYDPSAEELAEYRRGTRSEDVPDVTAWPPPRQHPRNDTAEEVARLLLRYTDRSANRPAFDARKILNVAWLENPRILEECVCDFLAALWLLSIDKRHLWPRLNSHDLLVGSSLGLHTLRLLGGLEDLAVVFPKKSPQELNSSQVRFMAFRAAATSIAGKLSTDHNLNIPSEVFTIWASPSMKDAEQFNAAFSVHNEFHYRRLADFFYDFFPETLAEQIDRLHQAYGNGIERASITEAKMGAWAYYTASLQNSDQ
jgi:hypothetical protein